MKRLIGILSLIAVLGGLSCSRDPEVVKRKYVENGNKYFERGKYKEASIMYRSALKKDLKFAEAYYRLGLTSLKLHDPIPAMRALQRAVSLWDEKKHKGQEVDDGKAKLADLYLALYLTSPPDRPKPKWLLDEMASLSAEMINSDKNSFDGLRLQGYLARFKGNNKEALQKFTDANAVRPMNPDLILVLCQVLRDENRFPEAEKLALELIEKEKSFGPIYDVLTIQYAKLNRLRDAEKIAELKARNNPKELQYAIELAAFYLYEQKKADSERVLQQLLFDPKDFPDAHFSVGKFYRQASQFDRAIQVFTEGLKSEPKRKMDYEKEIAATLAAQGKKDDAAKVVDEILKQDPKDPTGLAMRATLTLESGDVQKLQGVISELQASIPKLPKNPTVRFNLGRAYWAKGDLEQARTQFEEAIKMTPDYVAPRVWLAEVERLKGEFAKSVNTAQAALIYQPGNPQARLIRALSLRSMGNYDQARRELAALVSSNPNSVDAQLQLGILEAQQKNYKEAEKLLLKCKAASPSTDLRCLMAVSQVYNDQKQFAHSIEVLNEADRAMPERAEIRTMIGNTAVLDGKYDLAIDVYKRLLTKDPNAMDLQLRLGETYRRMGNVDMAIKHFRKAKDLHPEDPRAYIPLALMLDGAGRKKEATEMYEQVLKLQPDNGIVLNNYAYVIAETGGDMDRALTYAQQAKQKFPQDLNVADTLGWIYIKKNLYDNAIQLYRPLVAQAPGNSTFRYHLGMALSQKGDKIAARKELETALQNHPSKEEEGKIRELMAKIG